MALNPAQVAEALARGLQSDFKDTYRLNNSESNPKLQNLMKMSVPSDKASELYAYFESAAHPRRTEPGEAADSEGFAARSFTVINHDWKLSTEWNENDEMDDQLGGLVDQVQQGGANFGLLPERVAFQLLLSSTDLDLLPATPNAPDGAAIFAATAGGTARFGATGGNIAAGTGGGGLTTANVQADFYTAVARFMAFQDTKGQPLFNDQQMSEFMIIHGSANLEVFNTAFLQRNIRGGSGESNVVQDAGINFTTWATPRITDDRFIVVATSVPHRALFRQVRMEIRDNLADFTNSDRTRDTDVLKMNWKARFGFGLALPYNMIEITN